MPSSLPVLRRRRAAVFAERFAVRLLERAVGAAQRLSDAMTLAEQVWTGRRSDDRRVDDPAAPEVLVVEPSRPPTPPPAEPAPSRDPPLGWTLVTHISGRVERRSRMLAPDPWAPDVDRVEVVHDMRVATRRLRAFVDLFRPVLPNRTATRVRRTLRRIGRALGPLRELDVHVQLLDAWRTRTSSTLERAALEHVLERLERRRRRAETRARKALGGVERDRLRAELREITDRVMGPLVREDEDVRARVWELLEPRIETAFERMPPRDRPLVQDDGTAELEALHEIRIQTKRLRYAVELLRPALGDRYATLRKPLRRAQRVLGEHHDLALLHDLLRSHRAELGERGRGALADGLDGVIDAIDIQARAAISRGPEVLSELQPDRLLAIARAALQASASPR